MKSTGMSVNPYDYENRAGVLPISWEDFHALCKGLAAALAPIQLEIILPIGRGGYYPGTLIAHILQLEVYPIRLSRRVNDIVIHASPQWLLEPPAAVKDRRIVIVDEICATGETLLLAKEKALQLGAASVRTAVLYAHTRNTDTPDYIGLISDSLILNPWDREVYRDGAFHPHPEYVEALNQQGLEPTPRLLVLAETTHIAKR
jgi:uncharacterized protein